MYRVISRLHKYFVIKEQENVTFLYSEYSSFDEAKLAAKDLNKFEQLLAG